MIVNVGTLGASAQKVSLSRTVWWKVRLRLLCSELCSSARLSLAEILVLVGGAIPPVQVVVSVLVRPDPLNHTRFTRDCVFGDVQAGMDWRGSQEKEYGHLGSTGFGVKPKSTQKVCSTPP